MQFCVVFGNGLQIDILQKSIWVNGFRVSWFSTGGFEFVRLVESVGKSGIPLFFGLLVFVSLGSVSSLSELMNILKETCFSTTHVNNTIQWDSSKDHKPNMPTFLLLVILWTVYRHVPIKNSPINWDIRLLTDCNINLDKVCVLGRLWHEEDWIWVIQYATKGGVMFEWCCHASSDNLKNPGGYTITNKVKMSITLILFICWKAQGLRAWLGLANSQARPSTMAWAGLWPGLARLFRAWLRTFRPGLHITTSVTYMQMVSREGGKLK